jgi:predicted AlkP superfamily pyrophosphatase or phosphodiesterase
MPNLRRLALAAVATIPLLLFPFLLASQKPSRPAVLFISIDGLKPEAVLHAGEHGLLLPNLSRLVNDGAYATGVRGVLPTVTYPSHVTLLTGASPARHGILANTTFDPLEKNQNGWYWYAEDIKVPTLWDAAHDAGLKTANVYWPVSVGAKTIDYNLPQIWRATTEDDRKLQRALSTPGLEPELTSALGRYPGGGEETIDQDEIRARFAERILTTRHPDFMTVYLTGLDTAQHENGPWSPEANAVLSRLDAVVGQLRAAAEQSAPGRSYVCVVSDHGFARVEHAVNLNAAFAAEKLLTATPGGEIKDWKAIPWSTGGSTAIVLHDPSDTVARMRVAHLLHRLAAAPSSGIDRVLNADEMRAQGGFPQAEFVVSFKPGYELGSGTRMPLVSTPEEHGNHGYLAENPEMLSSFFLAGPGVAHGRSLGEIDMRQIAPTLATVMGISLSAAEREPLALH